jgi:amino acid adenylation domain-containing protein
MVGHYFTLLESAAAHPEQKIAQLPLLTAPEREQLLVEWNRTQVEYPKARYVHELFAEQAAKTPDAVAVIFDDKQLTYRELDVKSNQLAHHLRKLGVKADTLVGVCVERSLEMVIGLLGILKAGGAYVPLDPRYPKDRVEFVLKDAAAPVLLTQTSLAGDMPSSAKTIRLDADWATIAAESGAKLESATKGADLAYVIYTSGSTGVPKGVEIPHEALANFLQSMKTTPGLTAEDVLLAVTTISFDIAGLELFLPLITGAKLVVLSREDATDGFRLLHHLTAHNVTLLQATPATWRLLLDVQWPGSPKLKMLCGGEALPRDLADQLLAKGGELWNMYGPTETTVWSTLARVMPDQPIHIGRPIANTNIFILDAQLNPTPIGVPGELHIGGMGLARGYHNREQLTAEKFIKDPFAKDPNARIYKTGDLARYLPDGNIEHLGRLDHQVKLRGFRIELGEIEQVLNQHPGIAASTVVAREDSPGDKRLVAYVVNANGAVKPSELREHLRTKLPDYMVPAAFVALDKLPLTPNGKVDRKALPKPEIEAVTDQSKFVAPSTETEVALAKIWCDVLHLQKVGLNDNFFDIGGHSVLLLQVHARIGAVTSTKVSVAELFQYPTISALAQHLSKPSAAGGRLSKVRDRARRQAAAWSK